MTNDEKLQMVLSLVGEDSITDSDEEFLSTCLDIAGREIIAWRYSYSDSFGKVAGVPPEYEMTQIYAVLAGFTQSGAENQYSHTENGVSRTFKHADMIAYIRAHVIPFVKVM